MCGLQINLKLCSKSSFSICSDRFHHSPWVKPRDLEIKYVNRFIRSVAFDAGNYRGVHLTTSFSEIGEKVIDKDLIRYLQKHSFGENQWAFTPGLGARDLVTMLVMNWSVS